MNRDTAIARAKDYFDNGEILALLKKRVAFRSESQNPEAAVHCQAYLTQEMQPYLEGLGFTCRLLPNPDLPRLPLLFAERWEGKGLPTLLTYGHGDTVAAMTEGWREGLGPWELVVEGDRWYGRGTADNKGQHTINLAALALVLAERGSLGFNTRLIIETGEEMGSPGLRAVCREHRDLLRADLLIASDGPRLSPGMPTLFGGSRGVQNFDLSLRLRHGGHHSGNWGGLLANPGVILANAIACLVDRKGKILVPELKPSAIPESVRQALSEIEVTGEAGPDIDPDWGEPGLSPAEKVYGWSSLEVLAFTCGNPQAPAHAIPDQAWARLHIRFTTDCDPAAFPGAIRRHLDRHGFERVEVTPLRDGIFKATRLDPDNPWARWAVASLQKTCGRKPAVLPNLGGSLPNDAFADILGMPTIWVPHSYGGCSQHAPNEHLLAPMAREALAIMTGLFWDLGEQGFQG